MARPKKLSESALDSIRAEARPLLGGVTIEPEEILIGRGQIRARGYRGLQTTRQQFDAVNTYAGQPFTLSVQGHPVTLTTTCDYYFATARGELIAENRRAVERPREETGRFKPKGG